MLSRCLICNIVSSKVFGECHMNQFEALCKLASDENWCWNLFCSTCGHMHFRYSFAELAIGKSPESKGWIIHKARTDNLNQLVTLPRVKKAWSVWDVPCPETGGELSPSTARGCSTPWPSTFVTISTRGIRYRNVFLTFWSGKYTNKAL